MKRLVLCLIALTLWIQASAQTVAVGTTEAELIELKGKPVSKTVVGSKAIYRWEDMEVKLTNGKVTNAVPRNPEHEAEIREYNDLRNAEHRGKIESERERTRSETEAAMARSEAGRIQRQQEVAAAESARHPGYGTNSYVKDTIGGFTSSPSKTQSVRERPEVGQARAQAKQQQVEGMRQNQSRALETKIISSQIDRNKREIQQLNKVAASTVNQKDTAERFQLKVEVREEVKAREREIELLKKKKDLVNK